MAAGESILSVVSTVLTIVCTYDLRGQVGCMIGGMRAFDVSPVKDSYAFIKFFFYFSQLFFLILVNMNFYNKEINS